MRLRLEVFLTDNNIGDLPMAMGELKEKKVRALEFDGNPPQLSKIEYDREELQPRRTPRVRSEELRRPAAAARAVRAARARRRQRGNPLGRESDATTPAKLTPAPAPAAPAAPQPASKPARIRLRL